MDRQQAEGSKDTSELFFDFLANFSSAVIDAHTNMRAKQTFLDLFGTMLAASSPRYQASSIMEEYIRREGGRELASLVGRSLRTTPTLGALYNGTLAYYCDNEPHHPETVMHAPAVVVPAALAVGEAEGRDGEAFIASSILGIDVACRFSAALDPKALYSRGFHPSAVAGVFGATAACGYLLRLTRQQWRNAFGLAGLQACGLLAWTSDHTENSRPFNCGLAARNGVTAASLAALGFGGPPEILNGKYDLFRAFSGVRHDHRLTEDLGSRFYVAELAHKLYASCAFLHPGLDALMGLMSQESLTIKQIESMDLHFARSGAAVIDNNELKSHNAQYILAVAALRGKVTVDDILTDRLQHPEVARLAQNTKVIYDDNLDALYPRQYSSMLTIRTTNGRTLTKRVDWPRGYPQNPLTGNEVMEKFMAMATQRCARKQASYIAQLTLNLEEIGNVNQLGMALSLMA